MGMIVRGIKKFIEAVSLLARHSGCELNAGFTEGAV
jgi:hypothetical protein